MDTEGHAGLHEKIKQETPRTLPAMVNRLHAAALEHNRISITALTAEWQQRSTDPVHPFALLQGNLSTKVAVRETIRPDVYAWLSETFSWRPIFDWDWFVKPDHNNSDPNLPSTYERLGEQRGLDPAKQGSLGDGELAAELANQFHLMRDAGIPIHLLIGRRHPDGSSLYWGWPNDPVAWLNWLKGPLDANLRLVAPLVDTITVGYDLRNPLDEDRLEDIDELEPNHDESGHAICPRPVCPWQSTHRPCPFDEQWPQIKPTTTEQKQKMANGQKLQPVDKCSLKLASYLPANPPLGEYAQDWRNDAEDTDDADADAPLHLTARHAAFNREAVGWQKFWHVYAPKLMNLTELRVRMPRCFDKVGSVHLAKLLKPEKHWRMITYANERQHMQTAADVSGSFNSDGRFKCAREAKV